MNLQTQYGSRFSLQLTSTSRLHTLWQEVSTNAMMFTEQKHTSALILILEASEKVNYKKPAVGHNLRHSKTKMVFAVMPLPESGEIKILSKFYTKKINGLIKFQKIFYFNEKSR